MADGYIRTSRRGLGLVLLPKRTLMLVRVAHADERASRDSSIGTEATGLGAWLVQG
jgi:hypothetical protein